MAIGICSFTTSASFEKRCWGLWLTRSVNAVFGFACTVHANSARDALTALVNASIMAGENVTEGIVRPVLASSIDVVFHLNRDMRRREGSHQGIRRQVREVLAVAPSLTSGYFTAEPLLARLTVDEPMRWTGAFPPDALVDRVDRALPTGTSVKQILNGDWGPDL